MTPLLSIVAGLMVLPIFFAMLASFALFCALAALYASFRAAFGASEVHDVTSVEAESKRVLEERKKALLANLQDLEFDRRLDKIAEEDFQRLDKKLRAQAKRVLKLLDEDVAPFRAKAAEMIAAAVRQETGDEGTPYRTAAADAGEVEDEPPTPLVCGECETVNDEDAAFCKKCGSKFVAKTEADSQDENESDNGESGDESEDSESENESDDDGSDESESDDDESDESESDDRPGGAR